MSDSRKHVIARMEHMLHLAGVEMWFEDGMAVWVPYYTLDRVVDEAGATGPALVTGGTATLENVDGRWILARLELPK